MKKHSLINSFGFALAGIWRVVKRERNIKIQLSCAFFITIVGFFLNFNYQDWLVVLVAIGMVLGAELFNSSIEEICNLAKEKLKLEYQETAFQRDISAGAVLLVSFIAALLGIIIIFSKIF